jgi:hypothetical protein
MGSRRQLVLALAALAVGLAIGWNDSRPGWDDTGLTAGLLVVAGAVFGLVDPRRWWLWLLLVGLGPPLFEIGGPIGSASLAAFVFSGVGAAGGAGAARLLRPGRRVARNDPVQPRDDDSSGPDAGPPEGPAG